MFDQYKEDIDQDTIRQIVKKRNAAVTKGLKNKHLIKKVLELNSNPVLDLVSDMVESKVFANLKEEQVRTTNVINDLHEVMG